MDNNVGIGVDNSEDSDDNEDNILHDKDYSGDVDNHIELDFSPFSSLLLILTY